MNPHASEFVPSIKMDASEQRKYEQQHISKEILHKKQVINEQNNSLIILHKALNEEYGHLSYQMTRRENNEYDCYSKEEIDCLHNKYTQQSQIYYKEYAKFNDLTAELVALEQRLYRFLLTPSPSTTSPSPSITTTNDVNNNNNNNNINNNNSNTNNSHTLRVLDGIHTNNHNMSPPSTPCNTLPPILENEDGTESSAWNDDDIENETTITNDNIYNDYDTNSVVSTVIPLSLPDDIFNNECGTKTKINQKKEEKKEEKEEKEEEEEEDEEKENKDNKKQQETQQNVDKTEEEDQMDQSMQFENAINNILDNIMYLEIKTICDDFKELMISRDCKCNLKLIEILIDSIIIHGVNNNPKFFATKYSLLFQSILSYLIQNDGVHDIDELHELIWICCYDIFKKLQFGNDSNKFLNIMIIIAELFNANLLTSHHIFYSVFKSILDTNNLQEICENDIEGIYEIFKRCHRSLNNKTNRKELQKYLNIMNKIKNWRKFQNGMKRVPFMINQMQQTANY